MEVKEMKNLLKDIRGKRGMNIGWLMVIAMIFLYLINMFTLQLTGLLIASTALGIIGVTIQTYGWVTQPKKEEDK